MREEYYSLQNDFVKRMKIVFISSLPIIIRKLKITLLVSDIGA